MVIMVLGLALAGCGSAKEAPKEQKAAAPVTITIGVMPDVESIPFILAEKNGYFKKEGVQVKIEHFKSAKDRDSALQSGRLDGVITDVLAVVFANEGGIPLKIVSQNDGNIEMMAGKNAGPMKITELKGKSIGMSTNTIMEYSADRMLEAAGIAPADVKKIAIPPLPTRFEMLETGKIDAAIMPEPFVSLALKNGAVGLESTDRMKNKAGAIAFTGQSIKEHPTEIKAIFKAYNEAVAYINNEPAASYADYVIAAQGFPAGVKDSLALPVYRTAAAPDAKIVDDVVRWMKDRQLIKGNYGYKDLVDQTVLR